MSRCRCSQSHHTETAKEGWSGATTLRIKVKAHRGDPLNEETDIRAELDRLKEYKETIWNDSSDRTVYEWPVTSTKHGGVPVLKTSVCSNTVRNYIRQKTGEIEDYKTLAIGAQKWCKEHIPRNGNDLTEEGQILLEHPELWMDRPTFLWECHVSRKRERTTEDGTFLLHNKGAITSTFTGDWLLHWRRCIPPSLTKEVYTCVSVVVSIVGNQFCKRCLSAH